MQKIWILGTLKSFKLASWFCTESRVCFQFSERQLEHILKAYHSFPCPQEPEEGNGHLLVNKWESRTQGFVVSAFQPHREGERPTA